MKQLTIDTGVQEFEINGSGVLRFNPSDPNVYNRFFAAENHPDRAGRGSPEANGTDRG